MNKYANVFVSIFIWITLTKLNGDKIRLNFNYIMGYRKESEIVIKTNGEKEMRSYTVVFLPIKEFHIKVEETPEQIDSLLKHFTPIAAFEKRKLIKP